MGSAHEFIDSIDKAEAFAKTVDYLPGFAEYLSTALQVAVKYGSFNLKPIGIVANFQNTRTCADGTKIKNVYMDWAAHAGRLPAEQFRGLAVEKYIFLCEAERSK